ncbi:protein DDC8 homolog [Cynocephalus volans]|uniref:protein DDC8 homolog n=1 Tax=Cynocephalus volans TaxID=110931 RepID=UPI002FC81B86
MRRNVERATRRSSSPDDEALLLRQKHKLLQAREKGDVTLQKRPDIQQWKSQPLQHVAKELRQEWPEAQHQQVRDPERPLAHLLGGGGGGQAMEKEPDSEEPVQKGATRPLRAKEKHRAASREEKRGHMEEPVRSAWPSKSQKRAVGSEKQGALKAMGLTHPPPRPPERSQGKRAPSTRTGGGRHPVDPWVSRGMDLEKLNPLLAFAGGIKEKQKAQEGRRQLRKGKVPFVQGLKNSSRDPSVEGIWKDLEQLWPVGFTHGRGSVPQVSQCKHRDKTEWQKELEFAFEELFNINRKLKKHLSLHLESRPGEDQNPDEEQAPSELQEQSGETPREGRAGDMEGMPAVESTELQAHQTSSKTSLQKFLGKMENQKYHQMTKAMFKDGSQASSPKTGVFISEEDSLSGDTGSTQEPPTLAALQEGSVQLHLQAPADRAGLMSSRQKRKTEKEQRRQEQLELLEQTEHPNMSLEIHYKAELEEERRERRRARLAHMKSYPVRDQERQRVHALQAASPPGTDVLDYEDVEKHSQRIHDLQQQILEQNKLHQKFLDEARKRLQEFQSVC